MTFGLVITAAGMSSRFASGDSKLFEPISKLPMIVKTCQAFESIPLHDALITHAPGQEPRFSNLLEAHHIERHFRFVEGGKTRRISVENGVKALSPVDVVIVHDAARPFITPQLIKRLMSASLDAHAVVPGIPVTDTIKVVEKGHVVDTPHRDTLCAIQTPQLFRYDTLMSAFDTIDDALATDEAMLIEKMGYPVRVVSGDPNNRKITYQSDL